MLTRPAAHRLLALAAFGALAVGCDGTEDKKAGPEASGSTGPEGGPRDSLVVAYQSDADLLIATVSQSSSDSQIISNLNFGLVDSEFDCELKATPAIATAWEWADEGKTLKMTLRQDIQWSDGKPVTAEDIAFAYDLIADPKVASPRFASVQRMVEGFRPLIVDPTHIEWHFTQAYDRITQMSHVSVDIEPKHALAEVDRATLRGSPYATNPLTSGPWKLSTWDRNQRIVLEPNEKFTGPADYKPKLKRVIYKIIPEYATRLIELESGTVDLMEAIQVADADRLAMEHPEIKLHRRGWRAMDYIAWNEIDPDAYKAAASNAADGKPIDPGTITRNKIFADVGVRRALGKAINADKLIADLLTSQATHEVYGRRAVGTITPALCKLADNGITPMAYDPTGAKADLEKLGWKDTNGDGILDKGGVPLKFKLLTNSGNARRAKAAIIVQANLKDLGVRVDIEQVESNTFFERLRKKDYEAALSGWAAGLYVDPTDMWHSGPSHEFNFTSYSNPDVDSLIDQGMREPDPDKAAPIWIDLQRKIYEDQPYAFLYWMDEIVGVHERFQGVKIDILSSMHDLQEWWVPADKVKYAN